MRWLLLSAALLCGAAMADTQYELDKAYCETLIAGNVRLECVGLAKIEHAERMSGYEAQAELLLGLYFRDWARCTSPTCRDDTRDRFHVLIRELDKGA